MSKKIISWQQYFMGVAKLSAYRSKDPNTQVGACIVSPENKIVGVGYSKSVSTSAYSGLMRMPQEIGLPQDCTNALCSCH